MCSAPLDGDAEPSMPGQSASSAGCQVRVPHAACPQRQAVTIIVLALPRRQLTHDSHSHTQNVAGWWHCQCCASCIMTHDNVNVVTNPVTLLITHHHYWLSKPNSLHTQHNLHICRTAGQPVCSAMSLTCDV